MALPSLASLSSLSNLLLVTPKNIGYQPQSLVVDVPYKAPEAPKEQPPSFLFDYEGEQSISLESDITDHYIEDNSVVNDHIALKPETITTQGFIGEVNDIAPLGLQIVQEMANRLTLVDAYTPVLSVSALLAYNQAILAYQTAAQIVANAKSSIQAIGYNVLGIGDGPQNRQQEYFNLFYNYWKNRTLFTIQTPWKKFPNVAIRSLRVVQDADTNVITTFEVSFKVIRFAKTVTSTNLSVAAARRAAQSAAKALNGSSTPSVLGNLFTDVSKITDAL